MSRSAYCRVECRVCGRRISTAGFAQYNHNMKHVREGTMRQIVCGNFDWQGSQFVPVSDEGRKR